MTSEDSPAIAVNEAGSAFEPGMPPMAQDAIDEPRFANRRQSRTPAYISHASLAQSVSATVRDSSSSGARLELVQIKGQFSPGADRLPQRFILTIPMDRATVECEIAWRCGPTMGVRYLSPARTLAKPVRRQPKPQPPSMLAKMLGFGTAKGS